MPAKFFQPFSRRPKEKNMADNQTQMQQLQALRDQVSQLSQLVNSKAQSIQRRESMLKSKQLPNSGPQNLEANLRRNLGPMLAPGNLGDINTVIWPYFFSTEAPSTPLAQNQTFQTGFQVTQEAAFIWMSYTKVVYNVQGPSWGYITPKDDRPSAPGLVFTLRDGSSSRQFFNSPMQIDNYGNPDFPTKFPRPMMLLPNQQMQIQFTNTHPTNVYVPFITAFGYRMRVEDAQNMLGLVYG
jgi:hypothetical protein